MPTRPARLLPFALAAAGLCAALAGAAHSLAGAPVGAQEREPRGPAAGRGAGAEQGSVPGRLRQPEPDPAEADRFFDVADYDKNGWISFREASQALDLDQVRFSAVDKDPRDGRISREEFRVAHAQAVRSLGRFRPPRPDPSLEVFEPEPSTLPGLEPGLPGPRSLSELFGQALPRHVEGETLPRPPLIVGPVPVFRRLDLDADGRISEGDLLELRRPLQVPVRIKAMIASIDTDGDGAISHEEFLLSMGTRLPARRPD